MRLKHFLLSILAVAVIGSFMVAMDQQRRNSVLIPTLTLDQAPIGASLLGDLINGVSLYQYSASESAVGILVRKDVHNLPRCAQNATTAANVLGSQAPADTVRFWVYEYSGNENANNTAGKTGRELFDGKFFISDGEFASVASNTARVTLYLSLNTLTQISSSKVYYLMSEADLTFSCGGGIQVSSSTGGSSSSAAQESSGSSETGSGSSSLVTSSSSVSSLPPNVVLLQAKLSASQEVPPTTSTAIGTGTVTINVLTSQFDYQITNNVALTGDSVTGLHIHGPAAVGQTGGIIFGPLGTGAYDYGGTILTSTQQNQLLSGLWYFNYHSPAFPNGVIRGQIVVINSGSTVSSSSTASIVSSAGASSSVTSGSGTSSSVLSASGSSSMGSSVSSGGGSSGSSSAASGTAESSSLSSDSSSSMSQAVSSALSSTPTSSSVSSASALCGNGVLDSGEECDDGNLIDGDGCFSNCASMIPPPTFSASEVLSRFFASVLNFFTSIF